MQITIQALTKKKIAFFLGIIIMISLVFKFYFVDFSVPLIFDSFTFILNAIAYSNGDFAVIPKQNPGWPLIVSPFFLLVDSNDFLDYSNTISVIGVGIATFTIIPMYLLGRKFFNEKYSLVAASLFAFEPHLNRWSALGFAEPLYILIMIGSFYFILNNNTKFVYLSFALAGLLWWARLNGVVMLIVISIIFFINFRKSPKLIKKYLICIIIFFLVVSPILVQRYIQYEDPFYYYTAQNLFFDEDYETYGFGGIEPSGNLTAFNYIQEKGLDKFIDKFVLTGFYKISEGLVKINFPYLIILIPFGILFSLRAFDQDKKYVRANWVLILITIGSLVLPYAVVPEKRFLFPLYPFLILFCVIPIQRITEYGLNTFSFSNKQKKIFLVIVLVIILVLAMIFTLRYEKPDVIEVQEKMELSRILEDKLSGRIMGSAYTLEYHNIVVIEEPPGIFKTVKINRDREPYQGFPYNVGNVEPWATRGKSMEELILFAEQDKAKYLAINEKKTSPKFLEDVYQNEAKYQYLTRIYDSENLGFKKFKVIVFEIDFEKFHEHVNIKHLP